MGLGSWLGVTGADERAKASQKDVYGRERTGKRPEEGGVEGVDFITTPFGRVYESEKRLRGVDESAFTDPSLLTASEQALQSGYAARQGMTPAQQEHLSMLQAAARGEVPSVAQLQMQQGLDRAAAQQLGMAKGAEGLNPAMAMRMAGRRVAEIQQAGAGQMAQLRAQEMAQGRQMLGQTLAQQQGQLDDMTQFYLSQGMNIEMARMQAQQDLSRMRLEAEMQARQMAAGAQEAQAQRRTQLIGGALSAGGSIGAKAIGIPA